MKNNSFEQGFNNTISFTTNNKFGINMYQGEVLSEDNPLFNAEDYYKGRIEGLTKIIAKLIKRSNKYD